MQYKRSFLVCMPPDSQQFIFFPLDADHPLFMFLRKVTVTARQERFMGRLSVRPSVQTLAPE
jgi:hypothetical protein